MLRRLLLGAALVAGFAPAVRAAELDPALPSETESVIYVNVRQVLDSEIVKKYALGQIKQMMAGNDDVQKTLKELGLDPLKDIEKVTLGSWGKDKDDMQAVAVVRGKFNAQKLFAAAEKEAAANGDKIQIVKEGSVKMVKITAENQPKPFYATVADETTILAGTDKKLVAKTFAAFEKKEKAVVKKELAALLLKQDEKASMYIAAGTVSLKDLPIPAGIPGIEDPEKLGKQFEAIKTFGMTLKLTDDVMLDVVAGMKDNAAADEFGESLDGLIGTLKRVLLPIVAGQRPNLKPLTTEVSKTLKSKVAKDEVTLQLKLSADAIGKAAGQGD